MKIPPADRVAAALEVTAVRHGFDVALELRALRSDALDDEEAALLIAFLRIGKELEALGYDVAGLAATMPDGEWGPDLT